MINELFAGGLVINQQGHAVVAVSGLRGVGNGVHRPRAQPWERVCWDFLGPELGSSSQARRRKLSLSYKGTQHVQVAKWAEGNKAEAKLLALHSLCVWDVGSRLGISRGSAG